MFTNLFCLNIFLCIFIEKCGCFQFNESKMYAGLANNLADYFRTTCVYFLTDLKTIDSFFLEKTVKEISYKYQKSTNMYTFRDYGKYQAIDFSRLQCHTPLHVVVTNDEDTRLAFLEHTQKNGMYGSDEYGGGVWLVFLDSIQEKYIEEYFKDFSTPVDAQVIVAELRSNGKMVLKEVYRVQPDRPLRMPYFGAWTEGGELQAPPVSQLNARRKDLEGITLKAGYIESAPFTFNGTEDRLKGYLGDIWSMLSESINFTTKLTYRRSYGTQKGRGNWTGLMARMKNREYDVGIADFAFTPKRFEIMDYSLPLMLTTFQVYYKSMGSDLDVDALFLPLAADLWAMLVAWILIASILLYLSCCLSDRNFNTSENITFSGAILFVIGALCCQGVVHNPKRFTCRIFFFGTFLITTVIIPSYSASLMSYLAVLPPTIPFKSMNEFYDSGYMKMMVKYSSYEYDLFALDSSKDPYLLKIFNRDIATIKRNEYPEDYAHGLHIICSEKNKAFFGVSEGMEWTIRERSRKNTGDKCKVETMLHDAGRVSIGIAFPKKSHFKGIINQQFTYYRSFGLLKRYQNKYWSFKRKIGPSDDHPPVGIDNVFMIFVILGIGIGASLVLFGIEIVHGRKNRKTMTLMKKGLDFSTMTFIAKTYDPFFHALRRRAISKEVSFPRRSY